MPAKEQAHKGHKAAAKEGSRGSDVPDRQALDGQSQPAAIIHRASLDPRAVTPHEARQLQRTVGNQAVNRLLAGNEARVGEIGAVGGEAIIQREVGDASKLAEGQYAQVGKGETIKFTALAAGCMAVTVAYADGGGMGYHFAMKMDNAAQWSEFLSVIGKKGIAEVQLSSDFIGQAQGWYVKYNIEELEADTSVGPRSYASLIEEYKNDKALTDAGWVYASGSVSDWFKDKLGATPKLSNKTDVEIKFS
ncbi:MAG TPA: hypothetical protein VJ020_04405 [Anaerolineales bacterium]|nr:hypothetical protein [Anaerolineales bacterium]